MSSRCILVVFLILMLAPLPVALAHGAQEASETEVQILEDEADDSFYVTGGYDVYQVFVGEAHLPEAGAGPLGDGVYFRTTLYGDFSQRPPTASTYSVRFTFLAGDAPVTRSLSTTDGETFTTDFDALQTTTGDGEVEVARAFVTFASLGIAPGAVLSGFVVETFVDGEVRDRAPGGIYAPGSGGALEVPFPSVVKTEKVVTTGPTRYMAVNVVNESEGVATLQVVSLLKKGGQHVHVVARDGSTGAFSLEGEKAANLPAGQVVTFNARIAPPRGERVAFDVVSDLGGRVGLVAVTRGGSLVVVPEADAGGLVGDGGAEGIRNAPGFAGALALVAGGLALAGASRARKP